MAKRFLDRLTSEERKQYPMSGGLVDYFPDALALISHVSWTGNEKHNKGQPLHWSRWNSTDHADCVMRHHSTRDNEEHDIPLMHMAEESWRTLAMLQEAMEALYDLDPPRGARDKPAEPEPGRMTMEDYHDFADGLAAVVNIREPHDAGDDGGDGECIVQWTDISGPIVRIVASDGPFPCFSSAVSYANDNPYERPGTASICTLSRV